MHVLLAIDGSKAATEAARFLASLPFRHKLKLTIVTALVDSRFDLVTTEFGVQLREAETEAAHETFSAVRPFFDDTRHEIEHVVHRGHPSSIILDVARERDVDLIVLGAHGHSAIYRVVLGSTADYVANRAKCSVLVFRDKQHHVDDDDSRCRILLAYDGSPRSNKACEQLLDIGWTPSETSIHVAMMLERPQLIPDDVLYDPELVSESENALIELTKKAGCECELTHSVRETVHVGSALRVLAERNGIDLLFLGDTGKSPNSRFFLGSTSRYLLHHSDCSVWIARAKEWSN